MRQQADDLLSRQIPAPRPGRGIGLRQGTTQRFVLLLVLFITGSVYMFGTAFQQLVDPRNLGFGCELAAGVDPNTDNPANSLSIITSGFNDCLAMHASGWRYAWLPLAATALVGSLAMAHYALYPRWQRGRRRIIPLDWADPDGAVREALAGLESRNGIARAPDYVVDLSAGSPSARVFGRPGKYTVCLNAGLIALFGRDRDAFEPTMLHEFAHIRNRDIGITYLTVAIWRVFLFCALTPFALSQAFALVRGLLARRPSPFLPGALPGEAGRIALAAAFVVLIYVAMADVLRSREHFADLDAVALGADRVYWLRHVAPASAGHDRLSIPRQLSTALRSHPSWEKRTAILIRPRDVHTSRASSMFVTGMAAQFLVGLMGTGPIGMDYAWIQDNAIWPAAGLTTAVAGLAVWRNTAPLGLAARRPASSGLRAGFWLGAGEFAGALLLSQATGNAWSPPFPWVLISVLLIVVPTAILWWTAGCASLWNRHSGLLGRAAGGATIAVTAMAFAWWFYWWQSTGTLYILGNPNPISASFANDLQGFPHTATTEIIAAVLGPISNLQIANWGIWLTLALWILPLISARSGSGRTYGAWGGCAAAAAIILITFRAHGWNGHGILTISQNYIIYISWIYGVLLCAAVAAAFLASLRGDGHAVPAMAAAGITTALGAIVVVAMFGTDGCLGPLAVQHDHCAVADSMSVGLSAYSPLFGLLLPVLGMLTLVAAASAAAIVRVIGDGRPGQCSRTDPPAVAHARPFARHLAATGMCAACLVLAGMSIPPYLSDASLRSTPTTSQEDQGLSETAASAIRSAQLQADQMVAWSGLGGENFIGLFDKDTSRLAAMNPGGSPRGSGPEKICSAIMSLAAEAQAYLPPPDQLISPSWSAALGDAFAGSRECLDGLSGHDGSLVTSGVVEIYRADDMIDNIAGQIGDLLNAFQPVRHG